LDIFAPNIPEFYTRPKLAEGDKKYQDMVDGAYKLEQKLDKGECLIY